ncbi:MAG: ABC transporter ATP-binding protein [Chlamydiota bacterium]
MTPLLQVKNLKVVFKTHSNLIQAVRGVDFCVYPNETVGIVGESGCGKSVMVKALLKLFSSPSAYIEQGEVLYQNQNLIALPEKHLRKIRGQEIGMIFQDAMTSLNPTMSIGKQILENLLYHFKISFQEAYTKTLFLLNLVGIHPIEHTFTQYPHELSGGMRQRVMIAIALALSPKILIADEPTTALDATVQAQILQLLKDIQGKTHTSIVFITHDLSVVAGFCDRVIVMYAGKIIEQGSVDQLFQNPQHPYTKKLLESIPRLDASSDKPLNPIRGNPPNLSLPIIGCSFAPRCPSPLNICFKQAPPLFSLSKDSISACWQHDPRSVI